MAFMDELRQRNGPLGNGGGVSTPTFGPVSDDSGIGDIQRLQPIIDYNRRQKLALAKDQADYMANLQLRQGFMQNRMTPAYPDLQAQGQPQQNVIYQPSLNEIATAQSKAREDRMSPLDVAKFGLEREKFATDKATGQQEMALKEKQFGLDEQKNRQIYETKIADLNRKAEESEKNLKLATDRFNASQGNFAAQQALRQAQLDAMNDRHAADLAQRDLRYAENKRMNDARIDQMQKQAEAAGFKYETIQNSDGTTSTRVTRTGPGADKFTDETDPLGIRPK